jgi:hypothetical protein
MQDPDTPLREEEGINGAVGVVRKEAVAAEQLDGRGRSTRGFSRPRWITAIAPI